MKNVYLSITICLASQAKVKTTKAFSSFSLIALLTTATLLSSLNAAANKSSNQSSLVINSMNSDPSAKKAMEAVVENFGKENPNIQVKLNTIDHESYKVQIRTWLPNNPPDVATWFAGNRAKYFVDKGLVEPLDDVWKSEEANFGEGAKASVTFGGKKYLAPVSYYHWGFYYRKDLFEKNGIKTAPTTWAELIAAAQKLNAAGITPITIGTKQAWPSAAWFDLLNMRVNGYTFHVELLAGKHKFTDDRVKKTFSTWAELVKIGGFPKNAAAMTWQEASALLWQGKAAMYLMGNFISTEIPKENKEQIGFFPFPTVDEKIPSSQVAPTDVVFVPSKAKNKENGKKFVSYFLKAETQALYNGLQNLIPPNTKAKIDTSNVFLASGMKLLSDAKGLSQFFDRDAEPEVAKTGMDAFVEFMSFPEKLETVVQKMEKTRARVHK